MGEDSMLRVANVTYDLKAFDSTFSPTSQNPSLSGNFSTNNTIRIGHQYEQYECRFHMFM